MKVTKISVKNFRLLENITIDLDDKVTIIVGRNNSGKTSLAEVFNIFFGSDNVKFRFEDFSINSFKNFHEALDKFKIYEKAIRDNEDEDTIKDLQDDYKNIIPNIEISIFIEYEEHENLSSISNLIMDLDSDRKDALIKCSYKIIHPEQLIRDFIKEQKQYPTIVEFLKKKHKHYYRHKIYAVDAQNLDHFVELEKKQVIEEVFLSRFIYAQNQLDDQSNDKSKKLSKGFEEYYSLNKDDSNDVKEMEESLSSVAKSLDLRYKSFFESIFEDMRQFGVNENVNLQQLEIKSQFDPEKVIKNNTQVFYSNAEHLLPEPYNGLGYSKLIYILLKFISFYEEFKKKKPKPDFELLFIEEPEVHLHPQMQYVFIKNINDFINSKEGWNVQVIISTHSSHIVAESAFETIRYFDNSNSTLVLKNFSEFQKKGNIDNPKNIKFLKQYMSLNNCDMFFADKIIMIEGTVEKLLLPHIIKKGFTRLLSQYISVIEVGGAYAHTFKEFLEFINVKTLIITDIDSIDPSNKRKKVEVEQRFITSNQTLRKWLPQKEKIKELLECTDIEKTKDKIRVAYQIPESNDSDKCGRSFEEAFIIKNAKSLMICLDSSSSHIFEGKDEENIIRESYDLASQIDKKTDFAFDILLLENWDIPKYIKEGLTWLQD